MVDERVVSVKLEQIEQYYGELTALGEKVDPDDLEQAVEEAREDCSGSV